MKGRCFFLTPPAKASNYAKVRHPAFREAKTQLGQWVNTPEQRTRKRHQPGSKGSLQIRRHCPPRSEGRIQSNPFLNDTINKVIKNMTVQSLPTR